LHFGKSKRSNVGVPKNGLVVREIEERRSKIKTEDGGVPDRSIGTQKARKPPLQDSFNRFGTP
jgi:hypothetical protein